MVVEVTNSDLKNELMYITQKFKIGEYFLTTDRNILDHPDFAHKLKYVSINSEYRVYLIDTNESWFLAEYCIPVKLIIE